MVSFFAEECPLKTGTLFMTTFGTFSHDR